MGVGLFWQEGVCCQSGSTMVMGYPMQCRYPFFARRSRRIHTDAGTRGGPFTAGMGVGLAANFTEPKLDLTWQRGHPIIGLAFSPDGTTLAATMDNHFQDGASQNDFVHWWIRISAAVRRFDLDTCGQPLAWAPDGASIIVCGRILRLSDGSSCCPPLASQHEQALAKVLGTAGYWLDAHRVILPSMRTTILHVNR